MYQILIAEDEESIGNLLKLNLEQEGYKVFLSKDGIEAFEIFGRQDIALGIFDVMTPRLDGFNLLRKIRETSNMPVLFLTARSEEMDRILGLGLGADDYLVKPFSMAELMARVEVQIRRNYHYLSNTKNTHKEIVIDNLKLDTDSCICYKNDEAIELSAKEFKLLKFFMENPEKVFTKKQLYLAAWEGEYYDDENTIMVHISYIRNKIDDPDKKHITTIRGIGYKFNKGIKGQKNEN